MDTSIFTTPVDILCALEPNELDAQLLEEVTRHWHDTLMASPERADILGTLGLGLHDAKSLELGLSDRSLGLRLPNRQWKAGRIIRSRLQTLGVIKESGHEAFRGCVVVPVRSEDAIIAFFARRLERPHDVHWATGLPGGVFHYDLTKSNEAGESCHVLTMSILDALAILGVASLNEINGPSALTLLAPARPKGYSAKDLKTIAGRDGETVVVGRGSDDLVDHLRRLGVTVTHSAIDFDVARTLWVASDARAVLSAWLDPARLATTPSTPLASAPSASEHETRPAAPLLHDLSPRHDPVVTVELTSDRDELYVQTSTRRWRVRGARSRANIEGDSLKVALFVSDEASGRFHLDTLDLYSARQRFSFLDAGAIELRSDRDALVAEMREVVHAAEVARDSPQREGAPVSEMGQAERAHALAWLRSPDLLDQLRDDLGRLGVVGESTNLLVCYLAALSRKCEQPFGVLVQSSSAGGKSTLVEAVNALVPPEDLVALSAITSQALYYLGRTGLRHKVLFVAEEHGSSRAAYALKLLVSEGRLSIASTGKDARGELRTVNYETLGPLSLMMTTTSTSIDPELENRLVVLGIDEGPAQTDAIMAAQRASASLAGLAQRAERQEVRSRQHNVQRLLEPFPVIIPAGPVDFPSSATRHRRDHAKFLSMVAATTLLHQFQRQRHVLDVDGTSVTYLEATPGDVDVAVELCTRVLLRNTEGLAPQARRLLEAIREYAAIQTRGGERGAPVDVTRRQLRELLGWSDRQVRSATDRLVQLEYLVVSGGGRRRCRTYCLVPDFAPLARKLATSDIGEVGPSAGRTYEGVAPGESDAFAQLAPFVQLNERAHRSSDDSYSEVPGASAKSSEQ